MQDKECTCSGQRRRTKDDIHLSMYKNDLQVRDCSYNIILQHTYIHIHTTAYHILTHTHKQAHTQHTQHTNTHIHHVQAWIEEHEREEQSQELSGCLMVIKSTYKYIMSKFIDKFIEFFI